MDNWRKPFIVYLFHEALIRMTNYASLNAKSYHTPYNQRQGFVVHPFELFSGSKQIQLILYIYALDIDVHLKVILEGAKQQLRPRFE